MRTRTKYNILSIIVLMCSIFIVQAAGNVQTWIDYSNNAQLKLSSDGTFYYSNATAAAQGTYSLQNNVLMMQDSAGNYYQYSVQAYDQSQLVLLDQYGKTYSYVVSQQQATRTHSAASQNVSSASFPWNNSRYSTVLASAQGLQWRERDVQIYIEFLQFMIGQALTPTEGNAVRQDILKHFSQRPQDFINEVKGIETMMQQVYSLKDMQAVAMVREEMSTTFNAMLQQQPKMNDYVFVQTLKKYVQILSKDNNSNLSLSNQDVDAYVNYLQFQAMLMGQNYQLSAQERMTLQMQLVNNFNNYSAEQKQTLAFAGFIWNNLAMQWSNMSTTEQQQYIAQVQAQMNVQNVNVNAQTTGQEFWNNVNNYGNSAYDYTAAADKYIGEAAAQGLSVNQYVNQMQRELDTDQQMFTAMQNSMTESNVMMMNIINADSDYEYVVDYGNGY